MVGPDLGALVALLKAAKPLIDPIAHLFTAHRRLAEGELKQVTADMAELLKALEESSVEAQMAVRGTPNDPAAQESMRKAIRLSTLVGQRFASLFDNGSVSPKVRPSLIAARHRYRELVANEDLLEIVTPGERSAKCAEVESVCASFHAELEGECMRKWGVGLGGKAGRISGRRLPK